MFNYANKYRRIINKLNLHKIEHFLRASNTRNPSKDHTHLTAGIIFILFCLHSYLPDPQESDAGANTEGKQLPRPTSGDAKILQFA